MIPFVDLRAQYHTITGEIGEAVNRVLESSKYVLGPEVDAFESSFAAYCSAKHAIGVNTGTSALHLALEAAGVGAGDEVITVPFTFVATTAAIRYTGAKPVFVDIDPATFTMDPNQIEAAITSRTKAILPVHLYGQAADMDAIMAIAQEYGLIVIEDAAQAHGAEYKGRRVGSLGDMACFSFYPGKNLGAYGEGGMVVTNNPHYARTIRMLRDWGAERKYEHVMQGYNYRLEALQGAILQVKLRHLEKWTEARRCHALRYSEMLEDECIKRPQAASYARHVYHIYAIRTPNRDGLQQCLEAQGIQTGIHYPIPVHLQQAHKDLGYGKGDFPCSEEMASQVLSLPMFPELTDDQIATVCEAIDRWIDA